MHDSSRVRSVKKYSYKDKSKVGTGKGQPKKLMRRKKGANVTQADLNAKLRKPYEFKGVKYKNLLGRIRPACILITLSSWCPGFS